MLNQCEPLPCPVLKCIFFQVDDILVSGARWGVRFKTAAGRGAYIKNVAVNNVVMYSVKTAIAVMGYYGNHPDEDWNRTAYPIIENIYLRNIAGENITQAGLLVGLPESPFHDIHLANIALDIPSKMITWNCSWVSGTCFFVLPQLCPEFTR